MARPFTRAEAEEFFARLKKIDPEPKTELQYANPYTLLVAVVMSAQATDKGVNKATAPLFKTVKTPEQIYEELKLLQQQKKTSNPQANPQGSSAPK